MEKYNKMVYEVQKEKHKTTIEYFKFLTTLSTGSLVLLTSFLDGLKSQPNVGFLVTVSLVGFIACIIFSLISYTVIVVYFGEEVTGFPLIIAVNSLSLAWVSFLVATIALAAFGIANL